MSLDPLNSEPLRGAFISKLADNDMQLNFQGLFAKPSWSLFALWLTSSPWNSVYLGIIFRETSFYFSVNLRNVQTFAVFFTEVKLLELSVFIQAKDKPHH